MTNKYYKPVGERTKNCATCSKPFTYTNGNTKHCPSCKKEKERAKGRDRYARYKKDRPEVIDRKRQLQYNRSNERYANDPLYRLDRAIRNITYSMVKYGYAKDSTSMQTIGCTVEQLKQHIESQFLDGMSWDNYGEWHIDHITPLSWAKSNDEAIKLSHYTNLQPLWKVDNLSKGNRYKG